MKRAGWIVLALVIVQAALVTGWLLVERGRSEHRGSEASLGTAAPTAVDGRVRGLSLSSRAGGPFEWTPPDRPTLLHFWATWCPPCRAELPAILALPDQHDVDVVAVALDREWSEVDRFLPEPSARVFLGDTEQAEALGVRTLPVTLLVQRGGRIVLRFDGARDWSNSEFVRAWLSTENAGR